MTGTENGMGTQTGHRYYPDRWYPTWIRFAHEARYEWASEMVAGQRILDGACGTGYGTSLLHRAGAASAEGVDLSKESVAEAASLYYAPGLSFREADLTSLDVPNESFDVIVSFESIEHVDDDARYVAEMRRALRRGGTFLCSTPNRTVTNPATTIGQKPYNPFHLREYTAGELRSRLAAEFDSVSLLGQMPWPNSYCLFLARLATLTSPITAVRAHQAHKLLRSPFDRKDHFAPIAISHDTEPETLIAVCS